MTVEQFAQEAVRRLCDRCAYGDVAVRSANGDWEHGVDWRGEVYINPEPCQATVIYEMLTELTQSENKR